MEIWQADFYRRPLKNEQGKVIWELLICDVNEKIIHQSQCLQSEATSNWLVSQLQSISSPLPNILQVFRPQSLSLLKTAANQLGIEVEPTRRTFALKAILKQRASEYPTLENFSGEAFDPVFLEKLPPQPIPENLWGEEWRFATIPAGDIEEFFSDRPIPILEMPGYLSPIHLNIPSIQKIPGIVIYGGRQSLQLARWLQQNQPVFLNYMPTEVGISGGLVLEAGLADRWVLVTFEDKEVTKAAQTFEQRKKDCEGLHFLLIQPDDSGITYTAFWLLQEA